MMVKIDYNNFYPTGLHNSEFASHCIFRTGNAVDFQKELGSRPAYCTSDMWLTFTPCKGFCPVKVGGFRPVTRSTISDAIFPTCLWSTGQLLHRYYILL